MRHALARSGKAEEVTDEELVEATCAVPDYGEDSDPHNGALDDWYRTDEEKRTQPSPEVTSVVKHHEVQATDRHVNNGDRLCSCGESFKRLLGPESLTAHVEASNQ